MATTSKGFAYVQQSNNSTGNNLDFDLENLDLKLIPARVTDIILDETHPKFQKYGSWSSIGTIFYELINNTSRDKNNQPIAKPFTPQFKSPPLVNEIVLLFQLPDKDMGIKDTSKIYYYLNTVSLWNHPHHNAYPNVYQYSAEQLNKRKPQDIENGETKETIIQTDGLNLDGDYITGGNFVEKSNIQPLIPFKGDNIIESRFGSSIRFGNTSKTSTFLSNNWSDSGENGDPIMIIRNGQPLKSNSPGFVPTVEDINKDLSSIYITSNQKIPLLASSLNFTAISRDNSPTYPESYDKNSQIILNSGRLFFNSTNDSILLSSKKVINLSAEEEIGLASRKAITLESETINLGGLNATQPAIAGDTFLRSLKSLTIALEALANALNNDPKVGPATKFAGNILLEQVKKFNESYDSFTSKRVKIS